MKKLIERLRMLSDIYPEAKTAADALESLTQPVEMEPLMYMDDATGDTEPNFHNTERQVYKTALYSESQLWRVLQGREMLQAQANALHQVANALGCFKAGDDVTRAPWAVAGVVRERDTLQSQVGLLREALSDIWELSEYTAEMAAKEALAATEPKESK